ncbi:uncharacterized protein LOC124911546 [Impatiens glandulifera]|uniref:uncharacterized protein LOC124911546 n=1 Tax=Impatiens glandulifera TaxID=253017 RepID=UPI001FB134E1|nr:uncharacterized protein LOC124911546 [Impatiens glandulifera]XP_047308005.1 uncharacterized protein LOC124911546 [Impatiens glandulifera]
MATAILQYVQNLWPLSVFKYNDLRVSDRLVNKLSVPENTKQFIVAFREPNSQSVVYVLCVQNLSERSALDVEYLIREVRPDAVVVQVGQGASYEIEAEETESKDKLNEPVPTSSFEVVRRCFTDKINKERYENEAGSFVLRKIFGVGLHGNCLAAKKVAKEVGASFFLLESQSNCGGDSNPSEETESESTYKSLVLSSSSLAPLKASTVVQATTRKLLLNNDSQLQMVRTLSSYLTIPSSVSEKGSENFQPIVDYEAPSFAQTIYPLLEDLHNIFTDIPSIDRALACAQEMFFKVNNGENVEGKLLSDVHLFRIAVEGLRIALNSAGRQPINNTEKLNSSKEDFSELEAEEKSNVLLAEAIKSQTKKFNSIVAIVDASTLVGLRKHWNTRVPFEIKEMVEDIVISCEVDEEGLSNNEKKHLLSNKPMVAVGAGASAIIGASSLSKVAPVSSFMKVITLKVPVSLKIGFAQTHKTIIAAISKTLGTSKVVAPGFTGSGAKTSTLKAVSSARRIRDVTHSLIAYSQKTSLSAMRASFYEIMRKRQVRPIGFMPWATLGCSVATCASLLAYGDGIECVAESLPFAPSIATLGRGIQSLDQASQTVKQADNSRIQNYIDSLMDKFKKVKPKVQ